MHRFGEDWAHFTVTSIRTRWEKRSTYSNTTTSHIGSLRSCGQSSSSQSTTPATSEKWWSCACAASSSSSSSSLSSMESTSFHSRRQREPSRASNTRSTLRRANTYSRNTFSTRSPTDLMDPHYGSSLICNIYNIVLFSPIHRFFL